MIQLCMVYDLAYRLLSQLPRQRSCDSLFPESEPAVRSVVADIGSYSKREIVHRLLCLFCDCSSNDQAEALFLEP